MLRDFTESEKTKLLQFVAADRQKNASRFLGEFIDFFADLINYPNLNISSYLNNLDVYHQKLIDKNDMAEDTITALFDAVYDIDMNGGTILADLLESLEAYCTSIKNLTELISIGEKGVEASKILLTPTEFQQLSADTDKALVEYYMNKFTSTNDDGSISYQWEEIDKVLNKNAENISEMEYFLLANIYATMDTEELAMFLQALADKVEDIKDPLSGTLFVSVKPAKYTTWEYDVQKLNHLQLYLSYETYALEQSEYLISIMTEDQLQDVGLGDYVSKCKYVDDIGAQCEQIIQRQALLDICRDFKDSFFHNDSMFTSAVWSGEWEHDLTGEEGAFGPKITIASDEKGALKVTLCNTKTTLTQDSPISIQFIRHLNENTITISAPEIKSLIESVNEDTFAYYNSLYAYGLSKVGETIAENVVGGIINLGRDCILGVALTPAGGFIAGTAIDSTLDIATGYAEHQKRLEDNENTYETMKTAIYCDIFNMYGVIESAGEDKQKVIVYPTLNTYNTIENLNKYIGMYLVDNGLINYYFEEDALKEYLVESGLYDLYLEKNAFEENASQSQPLEWANGGNKYTLERFPITLEDVLNDQFTVHSLLINRSIISSKMYDVITEDREYIFK